jgi:hypothetical protein
MPARPPRQGPKLEYPRLTYASVVVEMGVVRARARAPRGRARAGPCIATRGGLFVCVWRVADSRRGAAQRLPDIDLITADRVPETPPLRYSFEEEQVFLARSESRRDALRREAVERRERAEERKFKRSEDARAHAPTLCCAALTRCAQSQAARRDLLALVLQRHRLRVWPSAGPPRPLRPSSTTTRTCRCDA